MVVISIAGAAVTWPHIQKGPQRGFLPTLCSIDANCQSEALRIGVAGLESPCGHLLAVQPGQVAVSRFRPLGNGMVIVTSQLGLLGGVNGSSYVLRTSSWSALNRVELLVLLLSLEARSLPTPVEAPWLSVCVIATC